MGKTRLAGPVFVSCLDTTTQTFDNPNTPQPISIDTEIASNGIAVLPNGEFQYTQDGLYSLIMFPILTKTVAQTISHFLWVQQDVGGGFVDIPDSNSETLLYQQETNDIKTITFAAELLFKKGTKIRFMNSTTNNNLTLVTRNPPAGNGPRIPSVIMSIHKIN